MAIKSFYLLNALAAGSNMMALQDGGSAPATATTGTGWTVGTTAVANWSLMAALVKRLASTFAGAPAQPNAAPNNTLGDCFRTQLTLSGQFADGAWSFAFPVIAVVAGGTQDGRLHFRLWRGKDPGGVGAVL